MLRSAGGINGCGFESPLESMYLALLRTKAESETSYDSCDSVNNDVLGNEGVADEDAVLHPMSRYLGLLDRLQAEKRQFGVDQEIIVGLIGGVGSDGAAIYRDASDTHPAFQTSFGIGPGCAAANPDDDDAIQAVPPVRLRELVDAFTPGNMFSICAPDHADALETIAKSLAPQIIPSCYTRCVGDTDPSTPTLDPECLLLEHPPSGKASEAATIRECMRSDAEGYAIDSETGAHVMPNDDVDVCYALLTDREDATATTSDDMSGYCGDLHFNLEVVIERRPGFSAPSGASISATCSLAEFPDVDCPGIGG